MAKHTGKFKHVGTDENIVGFKWSEVRWRDAYVLFCVRCRYTGSYDAWENETKTPILITRACRVCGNTLVWVMKKGTAKMYSHIR